MPSGTGEVSHVEIEKATERTQNVRRTKDRRITVFDALHLMGAVNPRTVLRRLAEAYPEVAAECNNLRFPGAGQRLTPGLRQLNRSRLLVRDRPQALSPVRRGTNLMFHWRSEKRWQSQKAYEMTLSGKRWQ